MDQFLQDKTINIIKVRIQPDQMDQFVNWQQEIHRLVATFPGFVSLEILSGEEGGKNTWSIVQRFSDFSSYQNWRNSKERQKLIDALKSYTLGPGQENIKEEEMSNQSILLGVTEMFVTQVRPDKTEEFSEWVSKIHKVEATFPGFRGMYVKSPNKNSRNWITFLQFDTPTHLDQWLASAERKAILDELQPLIASMEDHRVSSPFSGWFSNRLPNADAIPVWKQTMLILLVLFPIVMLELKFLSPNLKGFNLSFATFIGNAISVTLISWPFLPIAIQGLSWWLNPNTATWKTNILGTLFVLLLYAIEIIMFWNLL